MRPRSVPCLPRWVEVDQITSSTVLVSRSLRSRIAASTVAARCCGWRCDSAPLPGLPIPRGVRTARSEEHTSELQSLMRISYAVFCLKKKNKLDRQRRLEETDRMDKKL